MKQHWISNILFRLSNNARRIGKNITSEQRAWNEVLKRWHKENKNQDLRLDYDIQKDAIVFDLGGYQGQWASDIYARYLCPVYVFEPHPGFYEKIKIRFAQNDQIKIYEFGLGANNVQIKLSTEADSTSAFKTGANMVNAHIKSISKFMFNENIDQVDLMKINIEGGEYELLEYLIQENQVHKFKNLQIQFHNFVPDAAKRMKHIQEELKATHEPTYLFPFFWENWKLKTT